MPPQQVCTQYRTGRNSLQELGLQMGQGHPGTWRNGLTRNSSSLIKGNTKFYTMHQAWGWPCGKQLGREGLMSFLLDNKLSMSKQCSHEPTQVVQKWSQQVEGGDLPSLLSSCEITSRVLDPVLGPLVQDRHGCTGANALKAHRDVSGIGTSEKVRGWESWDYLTLSRESLTELSPMFINVS